jgi:hypothetical protein
VQTSSGYLDGGHGLEQAEAGCLQQLAQLHV